MEYFRGRSEIGLLHHWVDDRRCINQIEAVSADEVSKFFRVSQVSNHSSPFPFPLSILFSTER